MNPGFSSGHESVDRDFREIARGYLEKGVSLTRVIVEADACDQSALFYARFGFRPICVGSLRLFLPAKSLEGGSAIPRG